MAVTLFHKLAIAAPGVNTSFGTVTPVAPFKAFRVTVSLTTASVFKARVTDGTNSYDEKLNQAVALVASCPYTFDLRLPPYTTDTVPRSTTLAFRIETDGIVNRLLVEGLDESDD